MLEIHIYPAKEGEPVSASCDICNKPIELKPCVVILFNNLDIKWYCVNCVRIDDFCRGKFPCSK